MKKSIIALSIITVSIAGIVMLRGDSGTAQSVTASSWQAGSIISDQLFYDNNSMSAQDIQKFLNDKNPGCDMWGTKPASDWGRPDISRAEFAKRNGWSGPPFLCLKEYYQVPRSDTVINNYNETAKPPEGSISAAQIIKNAADTHGVSPKALLVLLQKESPGPLVTDQWPLIGQYRNAMGFACPDTAPCDPKYNGFYNQMMNAAQQIKYYKQYPNSYRHRVNSTQNIYFHPDLTRCGTSPVQISTNATAGLYNYTPYQPNQAALNNLYGTGDSCSAYGNRNFWRIYNDWFGNTQLIKFVPLDDPRWMQLKKDTQKMSIQTSERFGPTLLAGRSIRFLDKVYVNGEWILRTEWDKQNNNLDGIPLSEVEDIQVEKIKPTWMTTEKGATKQDPIRQIKYGNVSPMTSIKVVDKIIINGSIFYRDQNDSSLQRTHMINSDDLSDFTLSPLISPRLLKAKTDTHLRNILTKQAVSAINKGSIFYFNTRTTIDGVTYVQPSIFNGTDSAVRLDSLEEVSISGSLVSLDDPRWMQLKKDTQKISLQTNERFGPTLIAGRHIKFLDKVYVNDEWVLRTEWDKQNNNLYGIPLSEVEDIQVEKIEPTVKYLIRNTTKVDPIRGNRFENVHKNSYPKLILVDKITVGSKIYYRTEYERSQNRMRFIPGDDLSA